VTAEALAAWCAEVAAGFRGHEHQTQDPYRRDRDTALVQYALGALAGRADSGGVVEQVDRIRATKEAS
jgi:hypothetical protein